MGLIDAPRGDTYTRRTASEPPRARDPPRRATLRLPRVFVFFELVELRVAEEVELFKASDDSGLEGAGPRVPDPSRLRPVLHLRAVQVHEVGHGVLRGVVGAGELDLNSALVARPNDAVLVADVGVDVGLGIVLATCSTSDSAQQTPASGAAYVMMFVLLVLAMLPVLVQVSRSTHIGAHRKHRVAEATQPPVVFIMAALRLTMAVTMAVTAR